MKGLHLHHEFSPPAVVLVCHLLQTLDHLPEGGDQVVALSQTQEGMHGLEVLHRGVEHSVVVPVINESHAKQRRLNYLDDMYITQFISYNNSSQCY